MYKDLFEYGIIGNCRSCCLVSADGSIDWACFPDFDSPASLLSILDDKKGGFFKLAPDGFYKSHQKYIEDTNLLQTIFFNHQGTVTLTDLMPLSELEDAQKGVSENGIKVVRLIKAVDGSHKFKLELKLTPNFAQDRFKIKEHREGGIEIKNKKESWILYKKHHQATIKGGLITVTFDLKEGEQEFFALEYQLNGKKIPHLTKQEINSKCTTLYFETLEFWQNWSKKCSYKGDYKKQVLRSALTLKLLTYLPTGAIVAAPTTSLPEKAGGSLNWDYRFTWLRDASFTVYAFLGLGYVKEAENFMNWLENVCLKEGSVLKIMYGIHGEEELKETQLPFLKGYKNSRPVRIGNEASNQKQFDVFGEVLTAINLYVQSGGQISDPMKGFIKQLVNYCCTQWKEPDAGIWEPRYGYKHNTYSKLMCWVGIDRGIQLAKKLKINGVNLTYWEENLAQVKEDILKHGYNTELNAFVAYYGSKALDTSTLNIPLHGFLAPDDPKVLSTVDRIMQKLVVGWFVLRTSDEKNKLQEGEGTFFLSTFWLIDVLALLGRTEEARVWIDKVIHDATPLGLYGEEFDPVSRGHLGNFPQAFTHLGLINSILNLKQAETFGSETKPTRPSDRLKRVISSLIKPKFGLFNKFS